MAMEDPSTSSENEVRFQKFYLSGEPEATRNYPLEPYVQSVALGYDSGAGEYSVGLRESVAPGQMLIVANAMVSCACLRDCSPHTERPVTHSPTTLLSPTFDRIPLEAHMHLVHKLANEILRLEGDNSKDEPILEYIRQLDAHEHPRADITRVNLQGGPGSSKGNRGPWNEAETGVQGTLPDTERVWNIIANNAICYKVRSRSREEPSQVETCEYWGMWIMPSFINHSCVPNCHAVLVGNAIIIRAATAIAAGEEVTLPYFDIFQPLCKRELAAQRWGFRCTCPRCEFERSLGKPYDAIQEKIVNLEQQICNFLAWMDVKTSPILAERLLQKLDEQIRPLMDLQSRIQLKSQNRKTKDDEIPYVEQNQLDDHLTCICASFIQPLIASYAIDVYKCKSDEVPLPRDTKGRALKAHNVQIIIRSVLLILEPLSSVHTGNLLGEEFYAILLKASDELIENDRDENLSENLASQESYVTRANAFSRSRYGPLIKRFRPMNDARVATEAL